jgi:hypothetical protein
MSATFYTDLTKAIRTKIGTDVVTGLSIPLQYDNDKDFAQPESTKWGRVRITFDDAARADTGSPGANRHRVQGMVMFQLFQPMSIGTKAGWTDSDGVKNAFISANTGGATFRTPTIVNVGRSGKWWQWNVNCPFYADDIAN